MSSGLGRIERFLGTASFDRAPWLAVAFAAGIAAWFALPQAWQWLAVIGGGLAVAAAAGLVRPAWHSWPFLMRGLAGLALVVASGCAVIWLRSATIGTPAIARPVIATLTGRVTDWRERPAERRGRLTLAIRDPFDPGRAIRVRLNVPLGGTRPDLGEGAQVRVKARLMPPAPPLLPGGYDFARAAWFAGLAATGTALGPVEVITPSTAGSGLGPLRRRLARHIADALPGSPGGIAAALASGDRGSIAAADEIAMRDAGLTHLLSVSGLHVSAVIAAAYLLALRLLALWPWLALRVRLPLAAAGAAAAAGIFYTLLTGAEVPTLRSTFGALLVLVAVALGREPLTLRLLAAAAFAVMLLWPEAVIGPSFQLSFGAALAIVAVHGSAPMRRLTAREDVAPAWRAARSAAGLLVTGLVVELALLPIGLFHFHRAGLFGALANMLAIPLTTFVIMPLVALALLLDLAGLGSPVWWLAGHALDLLLGLAHLVARQPGAVALVPAMPQGCYALFLAGGLWLALWSGPIRRWGLLPIAGASLWLAAVRPADVLVAGDGRLVAFTTVVPGRLVVLRPTRSPFVRETVAELAGLAEGDGLPDEGETGPSAPARADPFVPVDAAPGARCNPDYCLIEAGAGAGRRRFLLSRTNDPAPMRDLVATCARVDVAIADRRLPWSCRPAWLKADRTLLARSGGLALRLAPARVESVAESQGEHGWWRPAILTEPSRLRPDPTGQSTAMPASGHPQAGLWPVNRGRAGPAQ